MLGIRLSMNEMFHSTKAAVVIAIGTLGASITMILDYIPYENLQKVGLLLGILLSTMLIRQRVQDKAIHERSEALDERSRELDELILKAHIALAKHETLDETLTELIDSRRKGR